MLHSDFRKLVCDHKLFRRTKAATYACKCGVEISDEELAALPKNFFKEVSTWIAYHFDLEEDGE